MAEDELDKALAELKKADKKYTTLQKEYDSARANYQPLTHAQAELDKAKAKHEEALAKWHELDEQFDAAHAQLIDAIDDARDAWYEAKKRVTKIIRKLTGADND